MATPISADPSRVLRALTLPTELVQWDEHLLALVESASPYPSPNRPVHWRCTIGGVPMLMQETLLEISNLSRIRSQRRIGSLNYEQTCVLHREPAEPERTHLSVKRVIANSVPILGDVIDRFDVRRLVTEQVAETLRGLQKWCESRS